MIIYTQTKASMILWTEQTRTQTRFFFFSQEGNPTYINPGVIHCCYGLGVVFIHHYGEGCAASLFLETSSSKWESELWCGFNVLKHYDSPKAKISHYNRFAHIEIMDVMPFVVQIVCLWKLNMIGNSNLDLVNKKINKDNIK